MIKRTIALLMIFGISMLFSPLHMANGEAKYSAGDRVYIAQMQIFSKENAKTEDAKKWCANQPENKDADRENDWQVIPENLNGVNSYESKSNAGVFICYQTTTDRKNAIKDIAVMNEMGNYSEGAYEDIFKKHKRIYRDMLGDMRTMLGEYRKNYREEKPSAVLVHHYLNTYKEDDSGKLLGDLLLDIDDANLTKMIFQANGQVLIMLWEQLAFSCDTGEKTWLEHMENYGGYDNFWNKFLVAHGNNEQGAKDVMNRKYHKKATILLRNWNSISRHFENMKNFEKKYGISKMSKKEFDLWLKKQCDGLEKGEADINAVMYLREYETLGVLRYYSYEESTLLDFFSRKEEDFAGENIKELYPLAASLSEGQIAALNETVSFYTLILSALQDETKVKKMIESDMGDGSQKEPVSVYDGMGREMFEGNVAVTNTALSLAKSEKENWCKVFMKSGDFRETALWSGAGALFEELTAVGSKPDIKNKSKMSKAFSQGFNKTSGLAVFRFGNTEKEYFGENGYIRGFVDKYLKNMLESIKEIKENFDSDNWEKGEGLQHKTAEYLRARKELLDREAEENPVFKNNFGVVKGLNNGFSIAGILLGGTVMSGEKLYKYYNSEHFPIPKYMVDLSYNEDNKSAYISYNNVSDADENEGNLNAENVGQWLALYTTTDESAGGAVLAPVGENNAFIIKGDNEKMNAQEGYYPLHLFGKSDAYNLSCGGGEDAGQNDRNKGLKLYFAKEKRGTGDGMNEDVYHSDAASNGILDVDGEGRGNLKMFYFRYAILFVGIGVIIGVIIGIMVFAVKNRYKD